MQRMHMVRGLALVLLLLPLYWEAAAFADAQGASAQGRADARSRASFREAMEARDAADRASIEAADAYQDGVRADNQGAIDAGRDRVLDYARGTRAEDGIRQGGFREEVVVQETWRYDRDLGDHVLDWQYRLVYKDGFGNVQFEAYFDQQGNVTTPFRESPWRVASRRANDALRGDRSGAQTAWEFDTDNQGREYPSRVIVQRDGINRVRMSFNESGTPWFWDIKDDDGRPISYGQGTQKPQYTDPEGPLAHVKPPRPGTGPCIDPDCSSQLTARNEVVAQMATLAAQINEMADTHARLDELAATGQHVDTRYQRRRHGELMVRYDALKPSYEREHAAWMACEEQCKKPEAESDDLISVGSDGEPAGSAAKAAGTIGSIGFQALLDSPFLCHYGNYGLPLVATPVDPGGLASAPGGGPATTTGSPATTTGSPATTTGTPATTAGAPTGAATATTGAPAGASTGTTGSTTATTGSPTATPSATTGSPTATPSAATGTPNATAGGPPATTTGGPATTSTPSAATPTGTPTEGGDESGSPSGTTTTATTTTTGGTPTGSRTAAAPDATSSGSGAPGGVPSSAPDDPQSTDDPPKDAPTSPHVPAGSTVLIIKSSAAASVQGTSSVLLVVPPAATDAIALPSNDCGASSCDAWKFDDTCSDQWFCDQGATATDDCTGSACDVAVDDCTGSACDASPAVGWSADCSGGGCDYVVEDPTCTTPPCSFTCDDGSCGVDVGFDQGPAKCDAAGGDTCRIVIPPVALEAGKFFIDAYSGGGGSSHDLAPGYEDFSSFAPQFEDFSAFAVGGSDYLGRNESRIYEVEVTPPDYNGYTIQIDPSVFSLDDALMPYYYAPIDIGGKTYANLLFPTAAQGAVDAALGGVAGLLSVWLDPCFIMWGGPDDPYYRSTGSWGQAHADQWALHRVGFPPEGENAWDLVGAGAEDVVVAVIDTGIDWNHRDLAWRNLWFNEGEVANNGVDDDGNGFVDDTIGWDFWDRDERPWDENGHGTVVSGIIAASSDNGQGIAGVNPHARIMPLRVLNAFGHTRASFLARALVYAVDNGARVVNVSLGGAGESPMLVDALDYAEERGVLVVTAAGNEAAALEGILPGVHPSTLTVASTDLADRRAVFSNHGSAVDLAAPGLDVLSLRARFTDTLLGIPDVAYEPGQAWVGADTRYYRVGGTSFSAPLVTGIASLLLARDPGLRAADLRRLLKNTARDVDLPGIDLHTGYGLVDARAALRGDPAQFVEARIDALSVARGEGGQEIVVAGRADADRFAWAEVSVGPGETPTSWRALPRIERPVASGRLAGVPAPWLGEAKVWAIRLVVAHEDGTRRETRYRLQLE